MKPLAPDDDDYFVLKPKHSGFYSTALDLLPDHLEVTTLILSGIAASICALFTANDAYIRDFALFVPNVAWCRTVRRKIAWPWSRCTKC